jgi:hypothetical protein
MQAAAAVALLHPTQAYAGQEARPASCDCLPADGLSEPADRPVRFTQQLRNIPGEPTLLLLLLLHGWHDLALQAASKGSSVCSCCLRACLPAPVHFMPVPRKAYYVTQQLSSSSKPRQQH